MKGAYTFTALVQFAGAFAFAGLVHPQIVRRLDLVRIPAEIAEWPGLRLEPTPPSCWCGGITVVIVPLAFKDYFNSSDPRGDAVYLPKVNDPELPYLLNLIYSGAFPTIPDSDPDTDGIQRADLVQVFLTGVPGLNRPAGVRKAEMLRLNLETELCGTGGAPACSTLGVLGGDVRGSRTVGACPTTRSTSRFAR